MARGKKWTIPFKSLNETSCRIDIYVEGYEGNVIELSPNNPNAPGYAAADPIFYEEKKSDNLLDVVRSKTGYINLIQTSANSLIDLFPRRSIDHYIEFYYGSTLDFVGFIQAQAFELEFTEYKDTVRLPIASPLGVLDGLQFPVVPNASRRTLGSILKSIIDLINDEEYLYTSVVFPTLACSLDSMVNTMIISKYYDGYDPADSNSRLFSPLTCKVVMEGICNAFGWIVHDLPNRMCFAMYDFTGKYHTCQVENLPTMSGEAEITTVDGSTILQLTSYFSSAGTGHKMSRVLPVYKLEWNYESAKINKSNLDNIHYYINGYSIGNQGLVISYVPRNSELEGSQYQPNDNIDSGSGKFFYNGVHFCSSGNAEDGSARKRLIVQPPTQQWATSTNLFTLKFNEHPSGFCKLKLAMAWGDKVGMFGNEQFKDIDDQVVEYFYSFDVAIECNSQFYNGDTGQWQSARYDNNIQVSTNKSNSDYLYINHMPRGYNVKLHFRWAAQPGPYGVEGGTIAALDDVIIEGGSVVENMLKEMKSKNEYTFVNNGSTEETAVNLLMSPYKDDEGLIGDTTYIQKFTEYTYMFSARTQYELIVHSSGLPSLPYVPIWQYSSHNLRMLSIAFHPWDDTYKIILQGTPTN